MIQHAQSFLFYHTDSFLKKATLLTHFLPSKLCTTYAKVHSQSQNNRKIHINSYQLPPLPICVKRDDDDDDDYDDDDDNDGDTGQCCSFGIGVKRLVVFGCLAVHLGNHINL
jgi:hypothetical protein